VGGETLGNHQRDKANRIDVSLVRKRLSRVDDQWRERQKGTTLFSGGKDALHGNEERN